MIKPFSRKQEIFICRKIEADCLQTLDSKGNLTCRKLGSVTYGELRLTTYGELYSLWKKGKTIRIPHHIKVNHCGMQINYLPENMFEFLIQKRKSASTVICADTKSSTTLLRWQQQRRECAVDKKNREFPYKENLSTFPTQPTLGMSKMYFRRHNFRRSRQKEKNSKSKSGYVNTVENCLGNLTTATLAPAATTVTAC